MCVRIHLMCNLFIFQFYNILTFGEKISCPAFLLLLLFSLGKFFRHQSGRIVLLAMIVPVFHFALWIWVTFFFSSFQITRVKPSKTTPWANGARNVLSQYFAYATHPWLNFAQTDPANCSNMSCWCIFFIGLFIISSWSQNTTSTHKHTPAWHFISMERICLIAN